jgi:hypothetical protein
VHAAKQITYDPETPLIVDVTERLLNIQSPVQKSTTVNRQSKL